MFSFKQFTIQQDKCAMKVCTDSCLFGAWVAAQLESKKSNPKSILDIGTGTGLLSLMLAQKTFAHFDALEIDADAALQAKENFDSSPWRDRLNVIQQDVAYFAAATKYDLIISNPPFYEADLRSANAKKNAAKHDDTLTLDILFKVIKENLREDGMAAVLLPWHRTDYAVSEAEKNGLFVTEKMEVKQTDTHSFFRTMLLLSCTGEHTNATGLIIHTAERQYTPAFTALLKDYYLKL